MRGKMRQQWGRMTESDSQVLRGKKDRLIGTLQKKYGAARGRAEKGIDALRRKLGHR
jgi:uncharacterized protein YjbJ (UPF0337 family)